MAMQRPEVRQGGLSGRLAAGLDADSCELHANQVLSVTIVSALGVTHHTSNSAQATPFQLDYQVRLQFLVAEKLHAHGRKIDDPPLAGEGLWPVRVKADLVFQGDTFHCPALVAAWSPRGKACQWTVAASALRLVAIAGYGNGVFGSAEETGFSAAGVSARSGLKGAEAGGRTGPPLCRIDLPAMAAKVQVILCTACRVGQNPVGLVDHGCVPFVATEIRVCAKLLHQCPVAGLDYLGGCVRLDVQDSVVVAAVAFVHRQVDNAFSICEDPIRCVVFR